MVEGRLRLCVIAWRFQIGAYWRYLVGHGGKSSDDLDVNFWRRVRAAFVLVFVAQQYGTAADSTFYESTRDEAIIASSLPAVPCVPSTTQALLNEARVL